LGSSNPWNLKQAKSSPPTLYDGHALVNPTHTSTKVYERQGTLNPTDYAELNALYSYFVPQKELSREQVYWLPAEEIATQIIVELEAEILKKQQMLNESEKRCAFIEKNHVNLQVKFQKYKETEQTLETELTQLKDALTSVRIQIDGHKAENVNLKRRYEELSKSNAYSRSTFTAKINALTAENAKLKTELSGKKSSGSTASEKPKVLGSGMYTNSSKYIPPPKRANWVKPTPLP
ncbi:hypothetical protein Tco_1188448, partial [Tanacetum coccineum]